MQIWNAVLMLAVVEIMNLMIHLLLPQGNLKKYASFVMGILVVYTLLGPLVQGIRVLDDKISGLNLEQSTGQYEKTDWQDYVNWYLGQNNNGQE